MFCNQCEQTVQGIACTKVGVCGKSNTLAMQNLLVYALRKMAAAALVKAFLDTLQAQSARR